MKKTITAIAAMLLCIVSFAQTGKTMYNKYSEEKGVSAVYISPAMFRMIGALTEIDMPDEDLNISSIVKELEGMYILESKNSKVNAALCTDIEKFLKNGKFEMLLEAKEDGERVRLYTSGDERVVKTFAMTAFEDDEVVFICFEGSMNRKDLEKLIASSSKK